MIRGVLTVATLVSIVLFPWPFAALLALTTSIFEPLVPLAAGIIADTFYYAHQAETVPLFAFSGAAATLIAVLVRGRLRAGIIGE